MEDRCLLTLYALAGGMQAFEKGIQNLKPESKLASKPLSVRRQGVKPIEAVIKTLALLDLLAESTRPVRLPELAEKSGNSRPTTYQRLLTLIQAGWVEQTDQKAYRLSLHSTKIGDAALEQSSLGERATSVLQELVEQVGETVSLAALSGNYARLVKRIEAEVAVRANVRVGALVPLDVTSLGRVLTAFASPAVLERLRAGGAALASPSILRAVRRNGYAISSAKYIYGVQSIAVPVFDARNMCSYALSIVAPSSRFGGVRHLRLLLRAAKQLTELAF